MRSVVVDFCFELFWVRCFSDQLNPFPFLAEEKKIFISEVNVEIELFGGFIFRAFPAISRAFLQFLEIFHYLFLGRL
jgi:hypothetical protein